MNKSISFIVPVYNVEKYLEQCLISLIEQDYNNYHIILINDGSTDNSKKICIEYQKKFPYLITLYNKKNGGLSSARNYGISKCYSDYVWFVDSDDTIEKNCLKKLMKSIKEKDILVFNYNEVNDNNVIEYQSFDKKIDNTQKRFMISSPSACNKIFKLDLFKKNNIMFPEGIYYEDLATIPCLALKTKKIGFDSGSYYNYYQRKSSIMHQVKYNPKVEDIFISIKTLEDRFCDGQSVEFKDELCYLNILHLLKNGSLRFLDFKKYDIIDKIVLLMKKKYPNWNKNIYFKSFDFKRKAMCYLIMSRKYRLIGFIRKV